MKKTFLLFPLLPALFAVLLSTPSAGQSRRDFREALSLYENGLLERARTMFEALAGQGDVVAEGYAVLCAVESCSADYGAAMDAYLERYPYSGLSGRILFRDALNKFDRQDYAAAHEGFEQVDGRRLPRSMRTEYAYKRAYSAWKAGSRAMPNRASAR